MKIYIQEMIRGHIEVIREEYVNEIIEEMIKRKIPFKVDYVYEDDIFDTMTQPRKKVVSTAKARESKIM